MWFQIILLVVFAHQSYEAGVTMDAAKTPCACGSVNRRTRIVGGQPTEIGEYPYMCELKQGVPVGSTIEIFDLCGAALVNKDWVISAAHCFAMKPAINQLLVYLGDYDSTKTTEVTSVIRAVSIVITHPNYNQTSQANDIALIKLNASVTYQWNIQPICLPKAGLNLFQQSLVITGWGSTEAAGAPSPVLREVTIPVIPNSDCKRMYSGTVAVIDDTTVCAGTPDGSKDACQGDSGGPAAWKCDDDGDYSLGCVVSYGIGCGNPKYPGVFTNVSNYLPWILTKIPGNTLCGSQCAPTPDVSDCGWANIPSRKKRIVGGWETTPNLYPWMVSIYIYKQNPQTGSTDWTFSCGGSIISRNWIITTAKCIYNVPLQNLFMVVGDYDITKLNEIAEKEVFPLKMESHPNYEYPLPSNDIALIQLTQALTFNINVSAICLPSNAAIAPNFQLIYLKVAGWGRNSTNGPYASKLKEAWLYATSNTQCKASSTINENITFCTASSNQGDACDGDIGDPLMLQGQSGRFYLCGLQSARYFTGCASGNPSINTRITPYDPWIESVSGVRPASTSDRLPIS